MNISKKTKTIIICIVYAIVIVIQFSACTPYTKTETYISSQNVPHTVIIERGYASLEDADGYAHTDKKGVTARQQINYSLFIFQLVLVTTVAALAYYFWCHKKTAVSKTCDTTGSDILRKQNAQLQETIDKLSAQVNKITLENEALRIQISTPPHRATEEMFDNEQLSLLDSLDEDIPPEEITVHTLSAKNGYYKDAIERTEENSALIDKWLDKTTGCLYMTVMYRDGEAESMLVTKEFFDTLYKHFDI